MSADRLRAALEAYVARWEREAKERGVDDMLYTAGVAAILRDLLNRTADEGGESAEEIERALAKAWNEGHRAGAMWEHFEHTTPEFGPEANPYGGAA